MTLLTLTKYHRKIGDKLNTKKMADVEMHGKVATYSRSTLNLNTIQSLYPLCRGRFSSITKTIDALFIKDNEVEIDKVILDLSSQKKIVSVTPSSIDTYVIKGISMPAKKVVTNFISQTTTSLLASTSIFLTSSVSSLLGFSINMVLAFKNLRKNGGTPTYGSYTYSFYALQFIVLIFTAFLTFVLWEPKYITYTVLAMVAIFFVINYIVTFAFKIYDKHVAQNIDDLIIQNMYNEIRKSLLEN